MRKQETAAATAPTNEKNFSALRQTAEDSERYRAAGITVCRWEQRLPCSTADRTTLLTIRLECPVFAKNDEAFPLGALYRDLCERLSHWGENQLLSNLEQTMSPPADPPTRRTRRGISTASGREQIQPAFLNGRFLLFTREPNLLSAAWDLTLRRGRDLLGVKRTAQNWLLPSCHLLTLREACRCRRLPMPPAAVAKTEDFYLTPNQIMLFSMRPPNEVPSRHARTPERLLQCRMLFAQESKNMSS